MTRFETAGNALDAAIKSLRNHVGDATAPIGILSPMHLNNALARRSLAEAGPQMRVYYFTPETLVGDLATRRLAATGLTPESRVRRAALVAEAVDECALNQQLAGYEETVTIPGWKRVLTETLQRLEAAGLTSSELVPSPDAPEWLTRRYTLLRALLSNVERRRVELGIASPTIVRDAALAGVEDTRTTCNEIRGLVTLGDRDLAVTTFEPLRRWLEHRPIIRVALAPVDNADIGAAPALRVLAKPLQTFEVAGSDALGDVQRNIWSPDDAPVSNARVAFVRTPDEVRENEEVVRFIQREVRAGTALDQIAVVLPDDAHREALVAAFDRSGIPATWFVTSTVRNGASARFLLHALDIAAGEQGVDVWYDLLRQRKLTLDKRISTPAVGRGRWRRLLQRCGGYSGTATICAALEDREAQLTDNIDLEASQSLRQSLEAFAKDAAALLQFEDLAEFAAKCRTFVQDWWRHSSERAQLLDVLQKLDIAGRNVSASPEVAIQQLEQLLDATPVQEGFLSDAAVRVLPPMACIGADFEVVCLLGLSQGRFPRRPSADPVLNDALITDLETRNPGLHLRREPALVEARRFAAAICAARRRLWLSMPAYEGLAERPRVPSIFALDVASAVLGKRATYTDLKQASIVSGSLATPYPTSPDDAIGAREYLVSGIMTGDDNLAAQLTSHPFARNLIRLHLDLASDREVPRSISTEYRLPQLDGQSMKSWQLAMLLKNPGHYFMRYVIGAWGIKPLRGQFSPLAGWWIESQLAEAVQRAMDSDSDFLEALELHWPAVVEEAIGRNEVDVQVVEVILELGHRQARRLALLSDLEFGTQHHLDATPQLNDLPWIIEMPSARLSADGIVDVSSGRFSDTDEQMIRASALQALGHNVDEARTIEPSGRTSAAKVSKAEDVRRRLEMIATLARRGEWVWGGATPWTLGADRANKLTTEALEALTGGRS